VFSAGMQRRSRQINQLVTFLTSFRTPAISFNATVEHGSYRGFLSWKVKYNRCKLSVDRTVKKITCSQPKHNNMRCNLPTVGVKGDSQTPFSASVAPVPTPDCLCKVDVLIFSPLTAN
jgi:hypothetical protein